MLQQFSFALIPLEFPDRSGIIRSTTGYSLLGKTEFWERLNALNDAISKAPPDSTIADLYHTDKWFKHNADRCLQLNGIDPDWCDGNGIMLTSFLFVHEGKEGLLIQYNTTGIQQPSEEPIADAGEKASVDDLIANLWLSEGSYEKAIEIAATRPYKEVVSVVSSKAELLTPAEEKAKRKRKQQTLEAIKKVDEDLMSGGFFKGFEKQLPIAG